MSKKVCVFIDNNSLFAAFKTVNMIGMFDYSKLKKWLLNGRSASVARFYCGEVRQDVINRQNFYDVLKRIGFEVISIYKRRTKEPNAALDQHLASRLITKIEDDMLDLADSGKYETFIVVSGNGYLSKTISYLRKRGFNVELVFFKQTCSDLLIQEATLFRELQVNGLRMKDGKTSSCHVKEKVYS